MPLSKQQKVFCQPQLIHLLSTVGPQRKEHLPALTQALFQEKFNSILDDPRVPQLRHLKPQLRLTIQ